MNPLSMRRQQVSARITAILLGAAVLVLVVHPALEGLHLWRSGVVGTEEGALQFVLRTLRQVIRPEMMGMILWMALIGGVSGLAVAELRTRSRRSVRPQRRIDWSASALRTLIAEGESETLEFKSSLRWDWKQDRPNKALEAVIAKSICGLMNHRGGTLLIGVDDDGNPLGIEADYRTFSRPNWDGFERCLNSIVNGRLGTRHCTRIHSHLVSVEQRSVALIEVEAGEQPVYCRDGNTNRYFVRTGNSTRELDVREAIAHLSIRRRAA